VFYGLHFARNFSLMLTYPIGLNLDTLNFAKILWTVTKWFNRPSQRFFIHRPICTK
jgi:hypothetical protein